jgi:hypothetical protein
MSRVASHSSIDRLELNPSAFANKVPTYLHARQSNRRGEPPAVRPQDMMRFYVSDDVEDDVRQCIRSWEHRHSISVTGRTETGEGELRPCRGGTWFGISREAAATDDRG